MAKRIRKKNLIVSYNNLDEKLKELFAKLYPDGYRDHLQRTVKPNGESIFVAPMETEDTVYMVKFEVKIDSGLVDEDIEKDLYGETKEDDDEFASINDAIDEEEGNSHVGALKHGDYEDIFGGEEAKKEFALAAADIAAEMGSDEEDFDDYKDDKDDDDDDLGDEPSDEALLDPDLDNLIKDVTGITKEEKVAAPRKRGRPKKNADAPAKPAKAAKKK